ncbi:hypothetical protein KFU94_01985 [Chloroflexi bacterium TSY]|nr:hypothetical protein [Chloroflexi bacterium TSY]
MTWPKNREWLALLVIVFGLAGILQADWLTVHGKSVAQEPQTLPTVVYLGPGPDTFEIDASLQFLVKRPNSDYRAEPPPSFTANTNERVWSIDFIPEGGVTLYQEGASFGQVDPECQIDYVQIDDNVDDRINRFFIDGNFVHEVEQGFVTYGSFTADTAGELTFFAEDSVGMAVFVCPVQETATPTSTATLTPTNTPTLTTTPTPTNTSTPTNIPPATLAPTDIEVIEEPTPEISIEIWLPIIRR